MLDLVPDPYAIADLAAWATARDLPPRFIASLSDLASRDPLKIREICDELAGLGYPWTANEWRRDWNPSR